MRGLMGKSETKVHKCLGFFCWLLIVSFVLFDFFYFELCSRQSFPLVFLTHNFLLPPLILLTTIMSFGFKTIRRLLITTAVYALLIACFTQWPFFASIRFAVAKPDFVSLLNRHETKQAIELPIWIGSFHVKDVQSYPKRVWFDLGHGCGNSGIVFSRTDKKFLKPKGRYYISTELSNHWFFAVDE
ncbi:hypothetical protein N9B60_03270 [Mariniblastus sp.]|nr:hypothetical protein [Mariniblastus sp.]MDA7924398.1 hypothetical protein [Mariniblastus sp.]